MLNQGRPVSQEELIEHVWDSSVDNFSNSIRVHISSLRKKLRNALGYDPIHNRISEGYVMEEKNEKTFFTMANNLNDHRFNLHNLFANELFNRFFRQTIYGFNRQRNISI